MTELLAPSVEHLDFDPEIICVCRKFCDPAEHLATRRVTLSCGCAYSFCQKALQMSNLRLKVRRLTCRRCSTDRISIRSVAHM